MHNSLFKFGSLLTLIACLVLYATGPLAAVKTNKPAPDFTLKNSNNQQVKLSDYKGKIVVLEWTNHKCPFVVKHYKSNNMQKLQERYTKDDVVWLSIISSAPNKQGFVDGKTANNLTQARNAAPTHVLLDSTGRVGKLYGARTTPHMYVIDQRGILQYQGAIDSVRSADPDDIAKATNYVTQTIQAIKTNQKVPLQESKPYGCSVKY